MLVTERPPDTADRPARQWWRPRWYELIPEAALAIGLTTFLIQETDAATSAFKSSRAVMLMVLGGVGWLAARVVLARLVRWSLVRTGLFAVGALGVLAVVVLPAYRETTVVETFPQANGNVAPAVSSAEPAASAPKPTSAASEPAAPVRFRVGSFRGVDHRASGTVALYRQPDGSYVVGLEDFDIQPGPDYDLYVVPGNDRDDHDGGTRLGDLRGNRGTQFYDAPPGADLSAGPWTVLVWCETFGVPVATATPS